MNALNDPEEKLLCPYNPAHHIMRYRMNTHLAKCKLSYPDAKLVECDFNVNHKIPEPELQYHHENCPDRKPVEMSFYREDGIDLNKYPINSVAPVSDDNWDEFDVPTYDPIKYCEKNAIIRRLDVLPAAPKKNFRTQERHRINELTSNAPRAQEPSSRRNVPEAQPSTSRRELPDKPRVPIAEETPESVAELMERLKLKCYVPKGTTKNSKQ